MTVSKSSITVLYYVPMMIVDLALTVLTMFKIFKLKQDIQAVGQSKAGSLLSTMIRQSIHYYVAITALVSSSQPILTFTHAIVCLQNIFSTVWTIAKVNSPQQALTGQISVGVTLLLTLHLALDLKADAYSDATGGDTTLLSTSWSRSFGERAGKATWDSNASTVIGQHRCGHVSRM